MTDDRGSEVPGAWDSFRSLFRGLPREAWWAAGLAAVVHMLPVWWAALATPDGWTFTGINTVSPDYMQYRVWMRQAPVEGWVVRDVLTSEPTSPFLPVALYWALGHAARVLRAAPELVYQYAGSLFAAALALTLYGIVRHFMREVGGRGQSAVFWIALLGGGLGGWIKLLEDVPFLFEIDTVRRMVVDPTRLVPIFEDYRQHYLITTLFDTHFLLIWLLALLSVMALYAGLREGGRVWALATGVLWALTSVVHVYTGLTLAVVAGCVLALRPGRPWSDRRAMGQVGAAVAGVGIVAAWMLVLQRGSGIPMPSWREPVIVLSTVLIAYPLQLLAIATGGGGLWRAVSLDRRFLAGWAVGCLLLTLSTPFYPYPSRGTLTLIVPLTLLAGLAYFRVHEALRGRALVLALVLVASTPVWRFRMLAVQGSFRDTIPHQFMSTDHVRVAEALAAAAGPDDLLMTTPRDALWLAPYHPGRNYAAHFFLTVDFDARVEDVDRFLRSEGAEAARFLVERGIDYLWVGEADDPGRYERVPGVEPLARSGAGTLFRVTAGASSSAAEPGPGGL